MTNTTTTTLLLGALLAAPLLTGCGPKTCKVDDPSTCGSAEACEAVLGQDQPTCFAPVEIQGQVFDLSSQAQAGIAGAQVTALDENGAPASAVATTDAQGAFTLRIPSTRSDTKGTPVARKVTLRAAAQDFTPFPSGIRAALPLDTGAAARASDSAPYILQGSAAQVGLTPLEAGLRGRPSISGTVDVDATQKGVLVTAETSGGAAVSSAFADRAGAFTLFNVAPATYSVRGYSKGVNYTPASVTVAAGTNATGVHVAKSATGTATLSSSVQVVAGGNPTSIVLAPKSTYDATLQRGPVLPGLRAPEPGLAANVSGGFSIAGIPDGDYVVLAGFENDGDVRDPDAFISGTSLQEMSVRDGAITAQPSGFKVTAATAIVSPGAGDLPDDVTTATPAFRWTAYPSALNYKVELIDSLGQIIWSKPGVTGTTATYDGPALQAGRLYQWRVFTYRNVGGNPVLTSYSEDLKGVFRYQP